MRFRIALLSFAAAFFPQSLPADEFRYEAVWHSGQGASLTTAPLLLDAFIETGDQLIASGLRLFDVETRVVDGQRRYAGLWTQGTGGNIIVGPIGAIDMREEIEARAAEGLRLIDFEIFRTDNGGRRYVGVWRSGPGEERLTGPMELDAFLARGQSMTDQGFRLWDVETEVVNGTRLYHGLFRTGAGLNQFVGPQSRSAFRATRDQMVADGLELRDIERINVNGNARFISVWNSGDGESRLSRRRSFPEFFIFTQDQFNNGRRAFDFEFQVIADDNPPDETDPPIDPENPPTDQLPANPRHVDFVGGNIFRIDWSVSIDGMPRIDIPIDYLPRYLPQRNGEPILPTQGVCGLNLREAGSAFWQIPGDPAFNAPPFNAVPDVPDADTLAGINVWGPILDCEGTQEEWRFSDVLADPGPFNPQLVPNLSLAIQFAGAPSINSPRPDLAFIAPFPSEDIVQAKDLWDDAFINDLLSWAELRINNGQVSGDYCDVSALIVQICEEDQGLCPGPDPQGNC